MESTYFSKLNAVERQMLTRIFEELNEAGIRAVILRGLIVLEKQERDPSEIDIDILIEDGRFTDVAALLLALGFNKIEQRKKASIIAKKIGRGVIRPQKILKWLIQGSFSDLYNEKWGHMNVVIRTFRFSRITVDIWDHLGHKSLLNNKLWRIDRDIEEQMLKKRVMRDYIFPVPSAQCLLAHILNRLILDKEGAIPAHYRSAVEALVPEVTANREDMAEFETILRKTYYKAGVMIKNKVLNLDIKDIKKNLLAFSDY